jgi:hypothetical protein
LQQFVTGVTEKAVGEEKVVEHDEKAPATAFSYAAVAAKAAKAGEGEADGAVSSPSAGRRDPPEVEIQLNGTAVEHEDDEDAEHEDDAVPDPPEEVPQLPRKSPEQVKDAFMDRFKEVRRLPLLTFCSR